MTAEQLTRAKRRDLVWYPLTGSASAVVLLWVLGLHDTLMLGVCGLMVAVAVWGSMAMVFRRPWALAADADVKALAELTANHQVAAYVRQLQIEGREVVEADVAAVMSIVDGSRPVSRFMSTITEEIEGAATQPGDLAKGD